MGPLKYLRLIARPSEERPLPHDNAVDIVNRSNRALVRDEYAQESDLLVATGTPVQSIARELTLSNIGTVTDGELFAIGDYFFELNASDGATPSNVGTVPAQARGTVTLIGLPTTADTLTVGGTAYDLLDGALTTGDIQIGATAAQTASYIASAINGDENNVAHNGVTAEASGSTVIITARNYGAGGDAIVFTESADNLTIDGGGTLGGTVAGVDPQYRPVDITATADKAEGTLTLTAIATADDTMTVGASVYTFKLKPSVAGEVGLGDNQLDLAVKIISAIEGTDGINTANATVSAAGGGAGVVVLTARTGGTGGNSIVSTETFTAAGNVFDATTLGTTTAGVDTSNPECAAAVVATITALALPSSESLPFSAVVSTNDAVITSTIHGAEINGYALYDSFSNSTLAQSTAGVSGTAGLVGAQRQDGSYLYTLNSSDAATKSYEWFVISHASF